MKYSQELKSLGYLLIALLFISSCQSSYKDFDDLLVGADRLVKNPYGRVPLGAELSLRTKEPSRLSIRVKGDIPVEHTFSDFKELHQVPVLGLYPSRKNEVEVRLELESGDTFTKVYEVQTETLPSTFPEIEIVKRDKVLMEEGMHLFDMLIANNGKFLSYFILFDDNGEIRWYMNMSERGQITYSGDKNDKGSWLYLDWINVFEINDLGKEIRASQLYNFAGNHHIEDAGDGKWLFGGSRKDANFTNIRGQKLTTRFDHVVEWDYVNNKPSKSWDLAEHLDVDRMIYNPDYSMNFEEDWFHLNSIAKANNGDLIASGRNQGALKVSDDNELIWILSPKYKWGRAGRDNKGIDPSQYVLKAIDQNGKPFAEDVQKGLKGTDEFEWSTGQHALNILPNNHLLLFDNGLSRDFKGQPTYSRAVEYEIDDEAKTIKQVWQYGKERGLDMYSPITSDVDVLAKTGNRLITAGNIRAAEDKPHAKMIEITYPNNQVVFEAKIYFKDQNGNGQKSWAQFDLVFKGERHRLYD